MRPAVPRTRIAGRNDLCSRVPRAKDGVFLHLTSNSRQAFAEPKRESSPASSPSGAARFAALRIDFVAKPGDSVDVANQISDLLFQADLYREGLQSSALLVSDREARLVTLLTFWDVERFDRSRERLLSWIQRLIVNHSDGPIRASTSVAHVLNSRASSKLTLADLRPDELAELMQISNAD
jgi:hypothetical protein